MASFVVDDPAALSTATLRDLQSGDSGARAWLRNNKDWRWFVKDPRARKKLSELSELSEDQLGARELSAAPALAQGDRALALWLEPIGRAADWRYGEARG